MSKFENPLSGKQDKKKVTEFLLKTITLDNLEDQTLQRVNMRLMNGSLTFKTEYNDIYIQAHRFNDQITVYAVFKSIHGNIEFNIHGVNSEVKGSVVQVFELLNKQITENFDNSFRNLVSPPFTP